MVGVDVDTSIEIAFGRRHPRDDRPVTPALDRIEAGPVIRRARRLKKEDLIGRPLRVEDQRRIAEVGAPAPGDERAPDGSLPPPTL
jgi:hypothetical protein